MNIKCGIVLLITALLVSTGCTGAKEQGFKPDKEAHTDEFSEVDKKAAVETLVRAVEEARESGKTAHIDVSPEDSGMVQPGDLVLVDFTATLDDGTLIRSTHPGVGEDPDLKTSEEYTLSEGYGPVEIVAGEDGVFPGLGAAVMDMRPGEKREISLPPEKAFGPMDPKKTMTFPCERRLPKKPVLSPQVYVSRFGTFPVLGREVELTPFFTSRIIEVTESYVRLESLAKDGTRFKEDYGEVEILVKEDDIVILLTPGLGAPFEVEDKKGRIVSTDGSSFTVDFNPPLTGHPVVLSVEVVSLTKASQFRDLKINWVEDHERGLELSGKEERPVVLILYSSTCSWSKRLLEDTLTDPRITRMRDDFVWVKVDSSREKDLYAFYDQDGYPLIVLLDPEGNVVQKISGFRPPDVLSAELRKALEPLRVGKK